MGAVSSLPTLDTVDPEDVLYVLRADETSSTGYVSRQATLNTVLGDTLNALRGMEVTSTPTAGAVPIADGDGLLSDWIDWSNIPMKNAQNVFTGTPNTFQSETGCTVNILAKGATGAQNDAASFQLQKTNDPLNERFIFTRYFGHSSRNSETWLDNRIAGAVSSALVLGNGFVNVGSAEFRVGNGVVIDTDRVFRARSYTVAGAPSAATKGAGAVIYVSNGAAGSPVLAFSDGTNWLRCDTRAAISTS